MPTGIPLFPATTPISKVFVSASPSLNISLAVEGDSKVAPESLQGLIIIPEYASENPQSPMVRS